MKHWTFLLVMPMAAAGCGKKSGDQLPGAALPDFDRRGLLQQISTGVIEPRFAGFFDRTRSLQAATVSLCQNLATGTGWTTAVIPVQTEWKGTMGLWQEIEAMQLGPLTADAGTLRYDIYTWPLVNACAVDRQVSLMALDAGAYKLSTNDSTKGLSAMEHLLFDDDSLHACKESVTETQGWNEKPESSRRELRCAYVQLLADDLVAQAEALQNKWNEGPNSYHERLTADAPDGELQSRINMISDSLFFLDASVKDKKLGTPLGLHDECPTGVCPELVEHAVAQQSLPAVYYNLIGFQAVWSGGDGPGFDDYLRAAGGEELAGKMQSDIEKAVATADALRGQDSLTSLLANLDQAACAATTSAARTVEVCALYQDIKAITDELKTEFVNILKLTKPTQVSGDND